MLFILVDHLLTRRSLVSGCYSYIRIRRFLLFFPFIVRLPFYFRNRKNLCKFSFANSPFLQQEAFLRRPALEVPAEGSGKMIPLWQRRTEMPSWDTSSLSKPSLTGAVLVPRCLATRIGSKRWRVCVITQFQTFEASKAVVVAYDFLYPYPRARIIADSLCFLPDIQRTPENWRAEWSARWKVPRTSCMYVLLLLLLFRLLRANLRHTCAFLRPLSVGMFCAT